MFGQKQKPALTKAEDEDQARNLLDDLSDEPLDLLADNDEQDQPPQQSGNPAISKMTLDFSRLNFKAKNQASTLSIEHPFASKFANQEIHQSIQQDRTDQIMQLFSNLPLDDDEQDFIDDPAKTARQA